MNRVYHLFLLVVISMALVNCNSYNGDEPKDASDLRSEEVTTVLEVEPFSQKELTELNFQNFSPYFSYFDGLDISNMDEKAFWDYAYEHNMVFYGGPMQRVEISVEEEHFFGCCPTNGVLYASAKETSISIKRLFEEKDDYKYLPYLYQVSEEYIGADLSDTKGDVAEMTQDPTEPTLLKVNLPKNETSNFRMINLYLKTLVDVPSTNAVESRPIEYCWTIIQFPWSDDVKLLNTPILTSGFGIKTGYKENE